MNLIGAIVNPIVNKVGKGNWVKSLVDGRFAELKPFQHWIGTSYDNWPLHIAGIETGALLSFANSMIGVSGGNNFLQKSKASFSSVTKMMYMGMATLLSGGLNLPNIVTANINEVMSTILKETLQPNIEGIPIQTNRITCSHSSEVSDKCVIIQKDMRKSYITDSVTVKPRKWRIEGYLTSMALGLDHWALIKPSLVLQVNILDALLDVSKPVLFKDDKNRFFTVLIENFEHTTVPETQNAIPVSITLQEFYPYEVETFTSAEEASTSLTNSLKEIKAEAL